MGDAVTAWEARGKRYPLRGHDVFVIDLRPQREVLEPLLILHGFPASSFDWRHVVDDLTGDRRVVLLDLLGFGLSAKPDQRYSLFEQADLVCDVAEALGIEEAALATHDMGDSVGGELLARELDGTLPFRVSRRVITNGSIYMDLAQLSPGQELLLALPDEALPDDEPITAGLFQESMRGTFGAATPASGEELEAQWELLARERGNRLLPRLIRYVEERRQHEERWTGAIERHRSPLTIVWGDADPIAVADMAERLHERRPTAALHALAGIGHWPMIEAPARVVAAMRAALW